MKREYLFGVLFDTIEIDFDVVILLNTCDVFDRHRELYGSEVKLTQVFFVLVRFLPVLLRRIHR